ncbi:carboxymuconolactone decarboxylase family protein [Cupriavidus sp. CuC1]|uniref:carboxymuconolactone decarboxylase family protein n=1 Tax=Cupriavidus sp. CuC1 TaxID=3373131 RepID=UPI0037D39002
MKELPPVTKERDLAQMEDAFTEPAVPARLRQLAPTSFAAASRYWQAIFSGEHLSPRLKELILVALHASVTSINVEGIRRHIERALTAGASSEEVVDVLVSIIGVSNHALYSAVPILMEELKAAGHESAALPEATPEYEAIKNEFVKTRGYWNEQRDMIARLMPTYCEVLSELSMDPWKHGLLSAKERELIYIAIDCSVTHMYEPGLAMHIRHALQHGATRDEILEVFQLAALMGLEGYILGTEALFRALPPPSNSPS